MAVGAKSVGAAAAVAIAAAMVALPAAGGAAALQARGKWKPDAGATRCPWRHSHQPIAERVAEVMHSMSLSDEIDVVTGNGTSYTTAIPQLCIPRLDIRDGPNGVGDGFTRVTELPASLSLAASFDPPLAKQYGRVIGSEEWGKGVSVNLGPTVNIDRDPRWGRSSETYGEDPFLDATLATSEIEGVQSERVMAQVKHFDAYSQETYRNTPADDVIVSDRALHEIYMPAFQAAIERAHAGAVMCASSTVNGNYSCQSRYLLTHVLSQEWDFPGFVMTDYLALHSTIGGAFAGTDMERREDTYYGQPLETDVQNGTVPLSALNTMVQRILTEMFRFNLIARPPTGSTSAKATSPAHRRLSNQVAQAGTVLLKNAHKTLPLSASKAGRVAVIGPSAEASPTYGQGGSTYVVPSHPVTPLQGLQSATRRGPTSSTSRACRPIPRCRPFPQAISPPRTHRPRWAAATSGR